MKKVSNFILASSLVLGFFVTPELFNITQAHAQESVKPYYSYSGYTANQSNFILDKNFKTSQKLITSRLIITRLLKIIKIYTIQQFTEFSNHKTDGVFFLLDGKSVSKRKY